MPSEISFSGRSKYGSQTVRMAPSSSLTRHGPGHDISVQPVADEFGELVDEVAQIGAAPEGHTRDVLPEQVSHRTDRQVAAGLDRFEVADGHLRHDADAQSESHIGGDDVRVDGFQRDARCELALGKRVVDPGATGIGRVVGDQRFVRDIFQADAFLAGQRMVRRQHQHMLPFVAGQGDEFGVVRERFGCDADLGHFVHQHASHLIR